VVKFQVFFYCANVSDLLMRFGEIKIDDITDSDLGVHWPIDFGLTKYFVDIIELGISGVQPMRLLTPENKSFISSVVR
jgi:hypothetical protein